MSGRRPLHPHCNGSVTCTVAGHVYARATGTGTTFTHATLTVGQRKTLRERRTAVEQERTLPEVTR